MSSEAPQEIHFFSLAPKFSIPFKSSKIPVLDIISLCENLIQNDIIKTNTN